MSAADGVLIDFASPCGSFTLTFDDDGKVAYAYLKRGKTLVGDVWVYNRCPTPDDPEWTDRSNLPFANPRAYTKVEGHFGEAVKLDDVRVGWGYDGDRPTARVHLFGEVVATVGVGDQPGFSRFAAKDGPLARVLPD